MPKTLTERLVTRGTIPSLEAGESLDVFADLLKNNEVAIPHFVKFAQAVQHLGSTADGYFTVYNPSGEDLTDVVWYAEHSHSVERDPVEEVSHVERPASSTPPGAWGSKDAFWIGDDDIVYVSPDHPEAADDTNGDTPYLTIQGAIDYFGLPQDVDDSLRSCKVFVVGGRQFDEDLTIPPGREMAFIALGGGVILGDVDLTAREGPPRFDFVINTSRGVTYQVDGNRSFTSQKDAKLSFFSMISQEDVVDNIAVDLGWYFTGNIQMAVGPDPEPAVNVNAELILNQCYIRGGILDDQDVHEGNLIIKTYKTYLQGAISGENVLSISDASAYIYSCIETVFDGQIIALGYLRFRECRFRDDVTMNFGQFPQSQNDQVRGLIACEFREIIWTHTGATGDSDPPFVDTITNSNAIEANVTWAIDDQELQFISLLELPEALRDMIALADAGAIPGTPAFAVVPYDTEQAARSTLLGNGAGVDDWIDPDGVNIGRFHLQPGYYKITASIHVVGGDAAADILLFYAVTDPAGAAPVIPQLQAQKSVPIGEFKTSTIHGILELEAAADIEFRAATVGGAANFNFDGTNLLSANNGNLSIEKLGKFPNIVAAT